MPPGTHAPPPLAARCAVLIACFALFLSYRAKDPERRKLDDAARAEAQDLFVRQLAELLDSLRITAPVDLAGLSFGGAIITSFADRHPERVRSLIYFDPVFNTGRPLPPEERSARAWNIHMVLRGGSDAMATGQRFDFLHPERHPDWAPATGSSSSSKAPARVSGERGPRSPSRRIRRSSSGRWARLRVPC